MSRSRMFGSSSTTRMRGAVMPSLWRGKACPCWISGGVVRLNPSRRPLGRPRQMNFGHLSSEHRGDPGGVMAHIVIVGGGLAAGKAAETLRDEGWDGDVTIVTAETHPPYQRPPLSKGYLAGSEGLGEVILHPAEWYREHDIDLRTGTTATALDPAAHRVTTAGGHLSYDALLLATGTSPPGPFRCGSTTWRSEE